MQRTNRKVLDTLVSKTKIYLSIIFILLAYIAIQNTYMILPAIAVFLFIVIYSYYANNKRKSEISETLQDLTLTVDSTAKTSLINSPFPLTIIETDGNVIWKSSRFTTEFANIDINTYIQELTIDIKNEIVQRPTNNNQDIIRQMEIDNKTYKIVGRYVKSKKNKTEYMVILYFIDDTENIKLQKEYKDSKTCVGIIMVDNYEETMQRLESEEKPQAIAEIDKCIYEWTDRTNGVLIKTEKDRYIYFFEQRYLDDVKEDKFSILDKVKEIDIKEKTQFTLSIAISNEGATDKEKYKSAETAMDIVLGRGGDQAVIRENEIYKFFGGRAQEVEKRTKVKARIVAQALENLIKDSKKVMIMGHTNPDMDCIGASLGIYRLAKTLEKNAYIIMDQKTSAIETFKKSIEKQEEYEDVMIDKEVAIENIEEDTLLVIVDTHKINYVESEELLDKVEKIVIIDHHRRSAEFIEKATLTFQEVYASSASELVTELIQYVDKKVELKTIEAESLYAGIMMDTKNFTFKTGVRTFEAAAYLRKCGVDIIRVKKWFQSDLASFNKIAEVVGRAEIVNDTIAISIYEEKAKDVNVICAKSADELLTISEITASFVIGQLGDKVCISGRSIGDINVQIILEKLGGGGHITLAGAQVEGMTLEETKQELINRINEYFSEIE
ncbi:MAG: phosphoesterase [Clostridia bacterium]|nr:phosphoesterase [Clostridia bacterium]